MISKDIETKYPLAVKFLKDHPEMNIDQAIEFLDKQIEGKVRKHETNLPS